MALFLHACDLGKKGLVILLHLIDFKLDLFFLSAVVIATLFHLPQLHFCALDFASQLLNLLQVSLIVLKLVKLLFQFVDSSGF